MNSRKKSVEYMFLSKEWIKKAVAAIEHAKAMDENVMSQASEFSLSVAYTIEKLPERLKKLYNSEKVTVYIELDQGKLTCFTIGTEPPRGKKPDFTVTSEYEVAKKNFQGELNPISTFMKRLIKVEPKRKLYLNPRFSAKSLSTINTLLKVVREEVPTFFLESAS
jgi:putative sterol carrier protein